MKLLIAEDDVRMRESLVALVKTQKYDADTAADGAEALHKIINEAYDVVILDVMMPALSGFEVAERARKNGVMTPILMLSAKGESYDKARGLDSGADDYMAKPFESEELFARLRALTRRSMRGTDARAGFGDIVLRPELKTVECTTNGHGVRLSEKEYSILEHMINNADKIATREELMQKIWGDDEEAEYNNVEVYMTFTRKKLAFVGSNTKIKAVRGQGYELRFEDV